MNITGSRLPSDPAASAHAEDLTAWIAEQYRGRLRLFAIRRLRDSATAEDVVQEALKTILVALRVGRVREPDAIASFAFETVRNLCMHRNRSHAREAKALEGLALTPAAASPDALTTLIGEERRRAVRTALDRLSEEDRRLLVMTYVDGRGSEDIGRELALTAGAVRVRRHRALKRLSEFLGVTIDVDREQD